MTDDDGTAAATAEAVVADSEHSCFIKALERVKLHKPENNIDDDDNDERENRHEDVYVANSNSGNSAVIGSDSNSSESQLLDLQLIPSCDNTRQLIQHVVTPSDYYLAKTYKGLDMTVSEDREQDVKVYEGQSGLPSSYSYT